MTSMVVVSLVAAFWVSSTVAVAPCDCKITAALTWIPECYRYGRPPSQQATTLGTHLYISKGELPTATQCVEAYQDDKKSYVTLQFNTGSNYSYSVDNDYRKSYLDETDANGHVYRLYVIHNEDNVYSYYRCIPKGSKGVSSGTPMGDIAVGCKDVNSTKSLRVINKAQKCFKKLGIDNLMQLPPCDC